jgi:hypothetical protein
MRPWLAILPVAITTAACGGAAASPARSATSQPVSMGGSAATPAPTVAAAPVPTPTPAPPPPLAVIEDSAGIRALDGGGTVRWSVPQSAINALVQGADAASGFPITVSTAGPNVLISHLTTNAAPSGRLAVIGPTGAVVYRGSFSGAGNNDAVEGSPDGTEWAWSVDATPAAAAAHHGSILVAGLTTPQRVVYSWVAPVGATELVGAWTDTGIVMERLSFGGCGAGFHPDTASFLVDPATGALTDLFTGGEAYADARHGVRVAFGARTRSQVLVNGVVFDETGTIVDGAYVSPDGASVGIARITPIGCGGVTSFRLSTEVVTVAGGAHHDLASCEIKGWFDATHFVGGNAGGSGIALYDLSGKPQASLGSGHFDGTIQPV